MSTKPGPETPAEWRARLERDGDWPMRGSRRAAMGEDHMAKLEAIYAPSSEPAPTHAQRVIAATADYLRKDKP